MENSKLSFNLTEQGDILNAYSRALGREAHILTQHPDLTWQQLYNRLQWDGDTVGKTLKSELSRRSAMKQNPWIHNRTKVKESGAFIRAFIGHTDVVWTCAISPDGHTIASGGYDKCVRLWDIQYGVEQTVLKGHTDVVSCCAFSPDGLTLFSASWDKTVRHWDARSGEELAVLKGHTGSVTFCTFSPDGRTLATVGGDKTVRLWDVHSGVEKFALDGHTELISSCAFSPDGSTLVSTSHDKTVRLWDVEKGKNQAVLKSNDRVFASCTYSPDGHILALGGYDNKIRLWDTNKWVEKAVLEGHTSEVNFCTFSPDGGSLASASSDETVRLWDIQSQKEKEVFRGHTYEVYSCAFSPDGHTLASVSSDKTMRLWDVRSISELAAPFGHTRMISSCAFSPDNRALASASWDKTIRLWDIDSLSEKLVLNGHTELISSCTFSPDGRTVASASWDNTIRLWDSVSGSEKAVLSGHTGVINSCAFSPGGESIASASRDKTIRLWDAGNGANLAVLEGHTEFVSSCAYSPDGQTLASASWDRTIRLWDTNSGVEKAVLNGHTGSVNSCAFSPNGRLLASAGDDKVIRLWDVQSEKEQATLIGHTAPVNSCSFSPNGRFLVSASSDNKVRLWDIESGKTIEIFSCNGEVFDCVFNPLGDLMAAGDTGGNVYLLELVGFETEPIILTAFEGKQGLVMRCPECQQGISVTREQLGSEIICPAADCGRRMKLNQFVVEQPDKALPFAGKFEKAQEALPATISRILADKTPEKSYEKRHIGIISLTDSGQVVIGYDDGCFGILNPDNDLPEMIMEDNYAPITTIANSLDGRLSASGSRDGMLQIWDLEVMELLDSFIFPHEISALAIGSNNQVLVGLDNGLLIVWDGKGGQFSFDGHEGRVSAIAFFPNGQIVTSGNDLKIRCWDPDTHEMLKSFTGIKSPITAMSAAGNGNQIVAGCEDKLLFIWDFDISKAKATYRGKSQVLAASGNQSSILMGNTEGKATVFSLETGTMLYNNDYETQIRGGTLSPDGKQGAVFDVQNNIYRFEIEH